MLINGKSANPALPPKWPLKQCVCAVYVIIRWYLCQAAILTIGVGAQSALGGKTFLLENICIKILKCPNFTFYMLPRFYFFWEGGRTGICPLPKRWWRGNRETQSNRNVEYRVLAGLGNAE